MEEIASGIDKTLLAKLVALARRGAFLRRRVDGADLICAGRSRAMSAARMSLGELTRAFEAGWIAEAGTERMHLTKRGLALVRRVKTAAPLDGTATGSRDRAYPIARGERPRISRDESPLAWLRRRSDKQGRPLISSHEFEAGERLRRDFWFAQMTPRVTASWSKTAPARRNRRAAPSAGQDLADHVIAARERVRMALAAVGPELAGVLIDVCCHLQGLEHTERAAGWPQRAGKVILQLALQRLARHYGIEPGVSVLATSRIRHWGVADYRPSIDGGDAEEGRGA
jgi:hypothetical protein